MSSEMVLRAQECMVRVAEGHGHDMDVPQGKR